MVPKEQARRVTGPVTICVAKRFNAYQRPAVAAAERSCASRRACVAAGLLRDEVLHRPHLVIDDLAFRAVVLAVHLLGEERQPDHARRSLIDMGNTGHVDVACIIAVGGSRSTF